jgi:hypothetical protein
MNPQKKSPIKSKPLRYAGKSLDQYIQKLILENEIPYKLLVLFFVLMTVFEWFRFYRDIPPFPITMTISTILIAGFCFYKIRKIPKHVEALKLGREGERAVGEYLDLLREKGYRVFHDIVGDNFNIDHLIVCTKGIYIIETKTYSKPINKNAKVLFDGDLIKINGIESIGNPVSQVRASSAWLKEIVKDSTGKEYIIKGVILFPGWYVKQDVKPDSNIWVLNPKALPAYLDKAKEILTKEDMLLASSHITRFIRSEEARVERLS